MVETLSGEVAKLGLLTHVAHCDHYQLGTEFEAFKYISFLKNHLYYLVNPTGSSVDFFPTFAPDDGSECFRVLSCASGRLMNWNHF